MSFLDLVRADFSFTFVCREPASVGHYVVEGIDISFEASFFVIFGLEGVALKDGANKSVSTHPCELHWSVLDLPGPYGCRQLKKRMKQFFQPSDVCTKVRNCRDASYGTEDTIRDVGFGEIRLIHALLMVSGVDLCRTKWLERSKRAH